MTIITKSNSDTYILTDKEKEILKEAQNIIAELLNDTRYISLYELSDYNYEIEFSDLINILHEIINNSNKEFEFEKY